MDDMLDPTYGISIAHFANTRHEYPIPVSRTTAVEISPEGKEEAKIESPCLVQRTSFMVSNVQKEGWISRGR